MKPISTTSTLKKRMSCTQTQGPQLNRCRFQLNRAGSAMVRSCLWSNPAIAKDPWPSSTATALASGSRPGRLCGVTFATIASNRHWSLSEFDRSCATWWSFCASDWSAKNSSSSKWSFTPHTSYYHAKKRSLATDFSSSSSERTTRWHLDQQIYPKRSSACCICFSL